LPRVPPGDDSRALQKKVQKMVREAFPVEMARINTPRYLKSKVRRRYRYQGWKVLRAVRAELARAAVPERPADEPVLIDPCGYGVEALLLAETHAGIRIRAQRND